jgi:hypothetical protein
MSLIIPKIKLGEQFWPQLAAPLDVLRYLVKENNISSRELGRTLGVDETLGSKILSGQRNSSGTCQETLRSTRRRS